MAELDQAVAVLAIIREADNAPSFQTIAKRGNFQEEELRHAIESLRKQGLIFSLDEDAEEPLLLRRFLTPKDMMQKVDQMVADHLAELAGEGNLYFAYGQDLHPDEIYQESALGSHFLCRALLENNRLVFNRPLAKGSGMAGLERLEGHHVWGILYYLSNKGQLDQAKKESGDLRRIRMVVKTSFGHLCCDSYKAIPAGTFLPSRHYLEKMIGGALFFGLPQHYLRFLNNLPTGD